MVTASVVPLTPIASTVATESTLTTSALRLHRHNRARGACREPLASGGLAARSLRQFDLQIGSHSRQAIVPSIAVEIGDGRSQNIPCFKLPEARRELPSRLSLGGILFRGIDVRPIKPRRHGRSF